MSQEPFSATQYVLFLCIGENLEGRDVCYPVDTRSAKVKLSDVSRTLEESENKEGRMMHINLKTV